MDEQELQQREQKLTERERALCARIVRSELAAQLAEAGCRPEAVADAAALMMTSATAIELAEDGLSVGKVTLSGEAMGAAAAAKAFVKARPYLAAPADDGSGKGKGGTPPTVDLSTAFGAPPPTPPKPAPKPAEVADNASANEMMAAGWAKPAE